MKHSICALFKHKKKTTKMAGMLPGVESARRRRVHKCGGFSDSPSFSSQNTSRRSSFCLYASNHESRISSSSSMVCSLHLSQQLNYVIYSFPFLFFSSYSWACYLLILLMDLNLQQRNILYQSHQDENMVGAARAAKQRLDDKFRSQRVSENIRYK